MPDTESDEDTASATDSDAADSDVEEPKLLALRGDLEVLDPSVIAAAGGFVLFHTGVGIQVKRSDDLLVWRESLPVFEAYPEWILDEFPDSEQLWGPDISYFGGAYHLYYGVSTFASNVSCIGHAVAPDLQEATLWTDLGTVICTDEEDKWNAIDPAWVTDENGSPWLIFGSYWHGIKAIALDEEGARVGDTLVDMAARPGNPAVAAPFILRRGEMFYQFVSFDQCCMGLDSTHNIRVGRADTLLGPYTDFDGLSMLTGGGTLLVEGNDRWHGPGHNAVLEFEGTYYNMYHAYDADNGGLPTLRISTIVFDADGLPHVAGP